MVYLSLTDTVAGDTVNESTQLNANWDQIDTKINALVVSSTNLPGAAVVSPEEGIESVNPNKTDDFDYFVHLGVYDGAAWRQQTLETWGAWQTITLTAPFVERSGFTPKLRISNTGIVEFRGGVINTAGASAWPTGLQVINSGQFADATYHPDQATHKLIAASVASTWAYGRARVDSNGGFMRLSVQFVGATGGGNFLQLEGLHYYTGAIA